MRVERLRMQGLVVVPGCANESQAALTVPVQMRSAASSRLNDSRSLLIRISEATAYRLEDLLADATGELTRWSKIIWDQLSMSR